MTIEHQIITDEDGQPTAAIIPWEMFQVIQAEIEVKAMLERRSQELIEGTVEGIESDELFKRVRERLAERRALASQTA